MGTRPYGIGLDPGTEATAKKARMVAQALPVRDKYAAVGASSSAGSTCGGGHESIIRWLGVYSHLPVWESNRVSSLECRPDIAKRWAMPLSERISL